MIAPRSPVFHGLGNRRRAGVFSAWTMAIVFVTVAMISFAIDQAVILSPASEDQSEFEPPSLLHPVQLIESLIDAASEPTPRTE